MASNTNCCKRLNCFLKAVSQPHAAYVVWCCRQDLRNVESKQLLIDKLREKINQCVVRLRTNSRYLEFQYKIVPETKSEYCIPNEVCRASFKRAWGIHESLMNLLSGQIKKGVVKTSRAINERYSAVDGDLTKLLATSGVKVQISPERLYLATLPNTDASYHCYIWLENRFELGGDSQPNSREIHLDPINKKDFYEEYVNEAQLYGYEALGKTQFNKTWRKSFPHVKVRKYKSCTGKCRVCAELSIQTRNQKVTAAMEFIKACRVIHRADFMHDRLLYHKRMEQAKTFPSEFISIITDGMQQTHCELPYSANRRPHEYKLKQHLQGVTTHGKRTRMYRTLDHISLGANATIYTLLCALEEEYNSSSCLPKTLYVQIDGGSENANYAVLAWMEILIYINVGIVEIWVSRMRTGHNHADQDAKFGRVWKTARNKYLLTPKHYERLIADVLKDYPGGAKLVDIFVLPDYVSAVDTYIDSNISHVFKGVYTQHIFRFQKVEVSSAFPLGSKCTYRASAGESFFEFVEDPKSIIGISPRKVIVDWHDSSGVRILTRAPPNLDQLHPQKFLEGAAKQMRDSITKIKASYSKNVFIEKDWNEFLKLLPLDGESAEAFVQRTSHGLHIRFKDFLAEPLRLNHKALPNDDNGAYRRITDAYDICLSPVAAGACVRWEGCLKPEPPRVDMNTREDKTRTDQLPRRCSKKLDPQSVVEGRAGCYIIFLEGSITTGRFNNICCGVYVERQ